MDFFLDNPFILVILIGLISSLFGKKENQEEKKKRPSDTRSPQRQPRQPYDRRGQAPQRSSEPRIEPASARELPRKKVKAEVFQAPELSELQEKYEEKKRADAVLREAENRSPGRLGRPIQTPSIQEDEIGLELKPDGERLIEGLAWSQILGEPRSKNPHRTMRRR